MTMCPYCQHQEISGVLFCNQCGARLFDAPETITSIETAEIHTSQEGFASPPPFPATPKDTSTNTLALYILDSDNMIPIGKEQEITLGRVTEGQIVVPNVDLSPFNAYEAGVSRLHANLSIRDPQITVKDLGSANGTRHNGKKIIPHIEHELQHGDILTLGKLKIQVLIRE